MEPTVLERTQRRLETELAEVCGHLNVLHERMVAVVAESLQTAAWEGAGIHSPEQWLAWQAGLSPERARQIVAVARRRAELPETMAAFAAGDLSVDSVTVVAVRAPSHNDREACDLARAATVAQLRKALGRKCFPPSPSTSADDAAEPPAPPPFRLSFGSDDDGHFSIHGYTDAIDGALIERALREAREALLQAGDPQVTWLDALLEVCGRSLGSISSPARRDLYQVILHVDAEGAWVHGGPRVPDALAQFVLCDGRVRPLWSAGGLPINMGRRCHIVPPRTRIVVEDRDRMCRFPTCASATWLQVHHIIHWSGPGNGETNTDNLVCLCPRHHRAHHGGEFSIVGNADDPNGLVFRDAKGREIRGSARPDLPAGRPPPEARPYQHAAGERCDYRWLHFRPPPLPEDIGVGVRDEQHIDAMSDHLDPPASAA